MPVSGFEGLREQLLRGGAAPRHVRRYISELTNHLDDLEQEEVSQGASQSAAKIRAQKRLGKDSDLADVMLSRPELRSLAARHPFAIFALGPFAMVLAAVFAGLAIEFWTFDLIPALVPNPSAAQREVFLSIIAVWNSLVTYIAPLAIAAGLCIVGLRQRTRPEWIFAAIACACVFGAFQEINFSDDGHHGALKFGSGLLPPFPSALIVHGFYRILITVSFAGLFYLGICWRMRVSAKVL